jgi:hypothetical protein
MTDPTRRAKFLCGDCSTVSMVAAAAPGIAADGGGAAIAVVHDDSCPWLVALAMDDRVQIDDHGAVVHFAASELPATQRGSNSWPAPTSP